MSKVCFKCDKEKQLTEFYKHPRMADGHVNKCKECNKLDVAEHRIVNIDKIRAYDRGRGNRQDVEYLRAYRKRYPKKYKAHGMLNRQIRAGNMSCKPCEICGDSNSVGHHDDYDKPLDVRWLCQAHHKQWHSKHGEGKNGV